jgi:predicted acetyltransferase
MNNEVFLVRPTIEFIDSYLTFYKEWQESGESMVPWVIRKDPSDFQEMITFLLESEDPEKLDKNVVPHSTYWLVDETKMVIGVVNIRHYLNEKLLNIGGHIGYGIRPSERRKGYASRLLALALEKTKEMGLDKVLLVCDDDNIGSEKTIVKNGGVFESEFVEEDGNIVKRFWINI